jgi:hypothetical protein
MPQPVADIATEGALADKYPRVRPIRATVWSKAGGEDEATDGEKDRTGYKIQTFDLETNRGQNELKDAFSSSSQSTVWLEASLEDLQEDLQEGTRTSDEDELAWYGGSYNVWKSADKSTDARPADWTEMAPVLESVDLKKPTAEPTGEDTVDSSLLRAIPYVFTRGTFGTIRDLLSNRSKAADEYDADAEEPSSDRWTAFPAVGFHPLIGESADLAEAKPNRHPHNGDSSKTTGGNSDRLSPAYTTIRTMVGAIGRIVVTVRLPDALCSAEPDTDQLTSTNEPESPQPLEVPRRFFPQNKVPRAREVAEAIGIHQAATVRAVANQVRDRLTTSQGLAKRLRRSDGECDAEHPGHHEMVVERRELRKKVVKASRETDQLAEIVAQLDQRISRLLRRFGGEAGDRPQADAPKAAVELVPSEVEKGYRHALHEVRSLHHEHRRTSEALTDALSIYDQDKRESFQHIAAILASLVLIPTLVASLFGVKFAVPDETSKNSFFAFLALVVLLAGAGLSALWMARNRDWKPHWRELWLPEIIGLAIVVLFVVYLSRWA